MVEAVSGQGDALPVYLGVPSGVEASNSPEDQREGHSERRRRREKVQFGME